MSIINWSEVSSVELEDELEYRGAYVSWNHSDDISDFSDDELENELVSRGVYEYDDISKIVQHHRCNELKIEGKGSVELINMIYKLANKII
jgi:hypothetical protein